MLKRHTATAACVKLFSFFFLFSLKEKKKTPLIPLAEGIIRWGNWARRTYVPVISAECCCIIERSRRRDAEVPSTRHPNSQSGAIHGGAASRSCGVDPNKYFSQAGSACEKKKPRVWRCGWYRENNIDSTDSVFWFQSLLRRKAQTLLGGVTHTSREACKRHISLQGHGGNIKCRPASREDRGPRQGPLSGSDRCP